MDYDLICRVAKRYTSKLPPSIDWRDLANEAAVKMLAGRKSIDGPMQDLLRKGLVGNIRFAKTLQTVDIGDFAATEVLPDAALMLKERIEQMIYDPILTVKEHRLLKAVLKDNVPTKELARRRNITEGRVSQMLTSIRKKLANTVSLRELYVNRALSMEAIAKLKNSTEHIVWRHLKRLNIERRPGKPQRTLICIQCRRPARRRRRCDFHCKMYMARAQSQYKRRNGLLKPLTRGQRIEVVKRGWKTRREKSQ